MDLKLIRDTPPWDWPEGIGSKFGKVLKDRGAKPSDRLIAAELAGNFSTINDELAQVLLTVLRDSSESDELRATAAIAFGPALQVGFEDFNPASGEYFDDDGIPVSVDVFLEIRDTMAKLYADTSVPKSVRRRILEGSVRAPMPWHEQAAREAYASSDPEWALTGVFAMQYLPDFEKEILEALDSADEEIHFQAVVAAGEKELDPAWPHIFALASDDHTEKTLRIAAILALGTIRPEEGQEFLWKLKDSHDEEIAAAAEEALSMIPEDDEFEGDDSPF